LWYGRITYVTGTTDLQLADPVIGAEPTVLQRRSHDGSATLLFDQSEFSRTDACLKRAVACATTRLAAGRCESGFQPIGWIERPKFLDDSAEQRVAIAR
jgi:hypothetical protein